MMDLINVRKAEALRLFLEEAKLAHLQVAIVNGKEHDLDFLNYQFKGMY
ncbi:hypothetical protein [Bacillus sp. C1]